MPLSQESDVVEVIAESTPIISVAVTNVNAAQVSVGQPSNNYVLDSETGIFATTGQLYSASGYLQEQLDLFDPAPTGLPYYIAKFNSNGTGLTYGNIIDSGDSLQFSVRPTLNGTGFLLSGEANIANLDFDIYYSGDYVTGLIYENATTAHFFYSGDTLTGASFPTYSVAFVYSGNYLQAVNYI